MAENNESPKQLQIGFPKSYAGEYYSSNVLVENSQISDATKDNQKLYPDISKLALEKKPESNELNQTRIFSNPSPTAGDNISSASNEPMFYAQPYIPPINPYPPPPYLMNSEQPINIPEPIFSQQTGFDNKPGHLPQTLQSQYEPTTDKRLAKHSHHSRRRNRNKDDDDEYSDNPSDYESDHNFKKYDSAIYGKKDYYDEDNDYIYYKTKDGRRFKHYR